LLKGATCGISDIAAELLKTAEFRKRTHLVDLGLNIPGRDKWMQESREWNLVAC
jgi:hypothetical protein